MTAESADFKLFASLNQYQHFYSVHYYLYIIKKGHIKHLKDAIQPCSVLVFYLPYLKIN